MSSEVKRSRKEVWNYFVRQSSSARINCFMNCGELISEKTYHRGHIKADVFGGTMRVDNLIPICGFCNSSMGTKTPKEYAREKGYKMKKIDFIVKKEGLLIYKRKSDLKIEKHDYETLQRLCIYNGVRANIKKETMIELLNGLMDGKEPDEEFLKKNRKNKNQTTDVITYNAGGMSSDQGCCKCTIL